MDLISRLRRSTSRQNVSSSSADPLQPLKSNWEALSSTLLQPDEAVLHHGVSRSDIPKRLRRLADDLVTQGDTGEGESAEGLAWALDEDIFAALLKLTSTDKPPGVLVHVVELFSRLTVELPAPFLASPGVHGPLARLLRICTGDAERKAAIADGESDEAYSVNSLDEEESEEAEVSVAVRPGSAEEHALVELLCRIASRLRNTPELLPVFFREARTNPCANSSLAPDDQDEDAGARPASPAGSSASTATVRAGSATAAVGPRESGTLPVPGDSVERAPGPRSSTPPASRSVYDFALLTHLLRFAHRESKTGELARSGLYFLFTRAFAPTHNLRRGRKPFQTSSKGDSLRDSDDAVLEAERHTSRALAHHLVESDFADVLGAGLGAVYGLLPPRISLKRERASDQPNKGPSMLGGGMNLGDGVLHDETTTSAQDELGLVDSSTSEVQTQLRVLVDLTEFIQLVMRTAQTAAASESSDPELASAAIALTSRLAEAIRQSFLKNILNPSLLECSDADNSSVAVLCYLDTLLQAIEDENALADVVVGWLVGDELGSVNSQEDGTAMSRKSSQQETISLSSDAAKKRKHARRRSVALHELQQEHGSRQADHFTGEGRYDLRDLILDHIGRGKGAATTIAALRLASTLLSRHGRFAIEGFLSAQHDEQATAFPFPFAPGEPESTHLGSPEEDEEEPFMYPGAAAIREATMAAPVSPSPGLTIGQHVQEIDTLFSLVTSIERPQTNRERNGASLWSAGYEHYLHDAEEALIRQSTYQSGLRLLENAADVAIMNDASRHSLRRSSSQRSLGRSPSGRRLQLADLAKGGASTCTPFPHQLRPGDRALTSLLRSLQRFFEHSPEENVALTGVLATLALCPYRSLDGWLVFERTSLTRSRDTAPEAKPVTEQGADDEVDDSSDEEDARGSSTARLASFWGLDPEWRGKRDSAISADPGDDPANTTAPVVVGILRSLVSQIWRYRAEVPGFDRLLDERRRGLTFVENLNDALGLESIASELVDEKSAPAPPTLSAPGVSDSMRLQDLWDRLGVPLEAEEQQESVALPLPPSATASDGFPESAAIARSQRDSNSNISDRAQIESTNEGSLETKKESSFTRWFGRRTSKPSVATPKAATEESVGSTPSAPPVQPFAQHYAHTAAVRVSARLARTPSTGPWSECVRAAEEAERQKQEMIDMLSAPAKPKKRTRFARRPSHVHADGDEEASRDDKNRSPMSPSLDDSEEYYLPGADDDEGSNAAGGTRLDVATQLDGPTLSDVLDNVVILEESIKELVAIVQVRRGLGIDSLSFA